MNDAHVDSELEQGYLAESRDLLADVASDLLTLERGGTEINELVINRVFRVAHSIKSGAGFFDLTALRDLAQLIESALDLIRCGRLVPSHEAVGVLSLGFDNVGELIQSYRERDQPDIVELADALCGLVADHLPAEERFLYEARVEVAIPEASRHVEASAFDLMQARRSGKYIYLIRYDLIRDIQRKGNTPWEVFKSLIESGTILETVLDLHSAGTLDDPPTNQLPLVVLYATALEPDQVSELIDLPAERVLLVETNQKPKGQSCRGVEMPIA